MSTSGQKIKDQRKLRRAGTERGFGMPVPTGSQEEVREGGHWTDLEDIGEKLQLEGGEEISWSGTCRTVKVLTDKVGSRNMGKEQ